MLRKLWQLFGLGLWLGSTIFGGVAAAYPVIRAKAVAFGWVSETELDGLYAISVLLPGPSFLNLWGAVATRVAGFPGAVAGQVGLMLPSFLLVVGLTLVERLPWVASRLGSIMETVAWATAGIFLATGLEGFRKQRGLWPIGVAVATLILLLLGLYPLALLALAILLGVLRPHLAGRKARA